MLSHLGIITKYKLTHRELEIIAFLVNGRSTKTIARTLMISPKTVDSHISNIKLKLNCNAKEQIIDIMAREGVLEALHAWIIRHYTQDKVDESHPPPLAQIYQGQATALPYEKISFSYATIKQFYIHYKKIVWVIVSIIVTLFLLSFLYHTLNTPVHMKKDQCTRSSLPVPCDTICLKRSHLIQSIHATFKKISALGLSTIPVVYIVGMGGMGKTVLARLYARNTDICFIKELKGETKDDFLLSLKQLAYALAINKELKEELRFIEGIDHTKEREEQLIQFIKKRLRNYPSWLLLYDNVETFSYIKQYLDLDKETWGKGQIVVTTRDKNINDTIYVNPHSIIYIDELTQEEKLFLLEHILSDALHPMTIEQKKAAIHFVNQLPSYPLDVITAAMHLKNYSMSYASYIKNILHKQPIDSKHFKEIVQDATNYKEARYEIVTNALEKLLEKDPNFLQLLFLTVLLDAQEIPLGLLELNATKETVNAFIRGLKKNALIVGKGIHLGKEYLATFSLHRSVQAIAFTYLCKKLNKEKIIDHLNESLFALIRYYKNNIYEAHCLKLLPLTRVLKKLEENLSSLAISPALHQRITATTTIIRGIILSECGRNIGYSTQDLMKLLENKTILQNVSPDMVADMYTILAENATYVNQYTQAIEWTKKSLTLLDKNWSDPYTRARNYKIMGLSYGLMGDFYNALLYINKAIAILDGMNETPAVKDLKSECYARISLLYSKKYVTADKVNLALESVYKGLDILGARHILHQQVEKPKAPLSCNVVREKITLARVANEFGLYEKAMQEGIKDAEYIINEGLDNCPHPLSILQVKLQKAQVYLRQNKLGTALDLCNELITAPDKFFGNDAKNWIAQKALFYKVEILNRLGHFDEAEKTYQRILHHKSVPNSIELRYVTLDYHAAFTQYKKNHYQESLTLFRGFFTHMKMLCKKILQDETYNQLLDLNVFDCQGTAANTDIAKKLSQCFYNSYQIFKAIYGENHTFVKDYVLINYQMTLPMRGAFQFLWPTEKE